MGKQTTTPRRSTAPSTGAAARDLQAWQEHADKAAAATRSATEARARRDASRAAVAASRQASDALGAAVKDARRRLKDRQKALAAAGKAYRKAKSRLKADEESARAASRKAARAQERLEALPVPLHAAEVASPTGVTDRAEPPIAEEPPAAAPAFETTSTSVTTRTSA